MTQKHSRSQGGFPRNTAACSSAVGEQVAQQQSNASAARPPMIRTQTTALLEPNNAEFYPSKKTCLYPWTTHTESNSPVRVPAIIVEPASNEIRAARGPVAIGTQEAQASSESGSDLQSPFTSERQQGAIPYTCSGTRQRPIGLVGQRPSAVLFLVSHCFALRNLQKRRNKRAEYPV